MPPAAPETIQAFVRDIRHIAPLCGIIPRFRLQPEDSGPDDEGESEGSETEAHLECGDDCNGANALADEVEREGGEALKVRRECVGVGPKDEVGVSHHEDFESVEDEVSYDESWDPGSE